MVLLEAAATGLPAVATDVGGVAEIVQPGLGTLVRPNDPEALAKGMIEMEDLEPIERASMGLRARARALGVFDLAKVTDQWEALFERALTNSRGRRLRRASRSLLTAESSS